MRHYFPYKHWFVLDSGTVVKRDDYMRSDSYRSQETYLGDHLGGRGGTLPLNSSGMARHKDVNRLNPYGTYGVGITYYVVV